MQCQKRLWPVVGVCRSVVPMFGSSHTEHEDVLGGVGGMNVLLSGDFADRKRNIESDRGRIGEEYGFSKLSGSPTQKNQLLVHLEPGVCFQDVEKAVLA